MDSDNKRFESVFTSKVRAGKRRTYFFDVRKTKGEDYYITITESTKRFNGNGFERHKIFLYKEDFNRFVDGLNDTVNHVKTELLPDYDYDEFTRKQQEWEAQRALEEANEAEAVEEAEEVTASEEPSAESAAEETTEEIEKKDVSSEDDMSW